MKPGRIVNVHAHIHVNTDVPARVKEWERDGCVRWCALADCAFWQPPNSTYLGNEGVLRWMREFPEVIIGMGSVELGRQMGVPDDISRLRDLGFLGLKLEMPSHPYDHDRYMPLYERAEALSMPILFHTGWVAQLEPSDRREQISADHMRPFRLDRIARAFPKLKVIGAHLGHPHTEEALCLILKMPNVYYDMSGGGGGKRHIGLMKKAMAPFPGASWDDPDENLALVYFRKILFGTDNPPVSTWVPAAEEIMDYLHVPEATRELFYWRTAAEVFGLSL